MAADGIDLKLEEACCLFLLGQGSEAEALERLRQVESSKSSGLKNSVLGNEVKDASAAKYSLNVLQDGFFGQEKRVNGSKQSRGLSLSTPNVNHRTISPSVSSDRVVSDECLASLVSSQHLGPAVKQLTPNKKPNLALRVIHPHITVWQALAEAAKVESCFWRLVLLQLSVLRADIFSDSFGTETAKIDVLLEEAAELIDSTYKIRYFLRRQDDGLWKFCKADVDTAS
ncbi:Plastid division protein CDP1 chloroplastic [Bienertia sinuspersici]